MLVFDNFYNDKNEILEESKSGKFLIILTKNLK